MLVGGVQATNFPNSMFPTDVPTNPQNIYIGIEWDCMTFSLDFNNLIQSPFFRKD